MRWLRVVVVTVLLAGLALALSPRGRRLSEAVGLLADVWAVGAAEAGGRSAEVTTIAYAGPGGRERAADLYCDRSSAPLARLLLVHGLVDAGKDDARLRTLGEAFARHRFAVLVPDFPGMRALVAGREDVAEVAAAIEALHGIGDCRPGAPSRRMQTGVVGFSYSAGPVLLALDTPARRADFAVLFGGYYDLAEVVRFLTTGRHGLAGAEQEGEILPEGRWILLEANAPVIADPADREALVAIARRRRHDAAALIDDLGGTLGPAARALLDLMANRDPSRFDALLAAAGPEINGLLADLSPSRGLTRPVTADLLLLHGRGDIVIPYTQSLALAARVPSGGAVRLAILGGFRHARPEAGAAAGWWASAARYPADSLRLLSFLDEVLARRGRRSLTEAPPDRSSSCFFPLPGRGRRAG